MPGYYPVSVFVPIFINPDTGEPAAGFNLSSFEANSSTPTPMFADKNGTELDTTITLNQAGQPELAGDPITFYLSTEVDYKFILDDPVSTATWTLEDVSANSDAISFPDLVPMADPEMSADLNFIVLDALNRERLAALQQLIDLVNVFVGSSTEMTDFPPYDDPDGAGRLGTINLANGGALEGITLANLLKNQKSSLEGADRVIVANGDRGEELGTIPPSALLGATQAQTWMKRDVDQISTDNNYQPVSDLTGRANPTVGWYRFEGAIYLEGPLGGIDLRFRFEGATGTVATNWNMEVSIEQSGRETSVGGNELVLTITDPQLPNTTPDRIMKISGFINITQYNALNPIEVDFRRNNTAGDMNLYRGSWFSFTPVIP